MFAVVKDCKRNPEKLSKIKRGESHSEYLLPLELHIKSIII